MKMQYFKVSKIRWDFDGGYPKEPQHKGRLAKKGLKTWYAVRCGLEDYPIDIISDLTGWCIFNADVQKITFDEFEEFPLEHCIYSGERGVYQLLGSGGLKNNSQFL